MTVQVASVLDLLHFNVDGLPEGTSGGKIAFIARAVEQAKDLRDQQKNQRQGLQPQIEGGMLHVPTRCVYIAVCARLGRHHFRRLCSQSSRGSPR